MKNLYHTELLILLSLGRNLLKIFEFGERGSIHQKKQTNKQINTNKKQTNPQLKVDCDKNVNYLQMTVIPNIAVGSSKSGESYSVLSMLYF